MIVLKLDAEMEAALRSSSTRFVPAEHVSGWRKIFDVLGPDPQRAIRAAAIPAQPTHAAPSNNERK